MRVSEDLVPAIKFCRSKSVTSTSKMTQCLVTGISGTTVMTFGHQPYVTPPQGLLNITTITGSNCCLPEDRESSQITPVCSFPHISFSLCKYIYKGSKSLAHLLSCSFLFFLSLFWNTFQLFTRLELTGLMSSLIQHLGCSLTCALLLNELKGSNY